MRRTTRGQKERIIFEATLLWLRRKLEQRLGYRSICEFSETRAMFGTSPSLLLTSSSNSFVLPAAFAGSIAVNRDIFVFLHCHVSSD
jgi:isochorismate synthase EntC